MSSSYDKILEELITEAHLNEDLRFRLLTACKSLGRLGKTHPKKRAAVFDIVNHLALHGKDSLSETLGRMSRQELSKLAKKHQVCVNSDIKKLNQFDLVSKIIETAEKKLGQGNAFL